MTHTHELKVLPEYFNAISTGEKTFELRKDDRGFQVGDKLVLREWDTNGYSGREITCRVTYMLKGFAGLQDGYAVLSIVIDGYRP